MEAKLDAPTIRALYEIREGIEHSRLFPRSLRGACNVSALLVQGLLEESGIPSVIANNSRHCFNMIENGSIIVDLTATQINMSAFSKIEVGYYESVAAKSRTSIKGRRFYSLEDSSFYAQGGLSDILRLRRDNPRDRSGLQTLMGKAEIILKQLGFEAEAIAECNLYGLDDDEVDSLCMKMAGNIRQYGKRLVMKYCGDENKCSPLFKARGSDAEECRGVSQKR